MLTVSRPSVVREIASDVRLGVVAGFLLAAFFCVIALLVFLFKGSAAFDSNHTSLGRALSTYLIAGVTGGLLVGLLLRLTKWVLGAAMVGFAGAFILWFVVGWSMNPGEPILGILKSSLVLAAAFGLPLGIGLWLMVRKYQRTGKW